MGRRLLPHLCSRRGARALATAQAGPSHLPAAPEGLEEGPLGLPRKIQLLVLEQREWGQQELFWGGFTCSICQAGLAVDATLGLTSSCKVSSDGELGRPVSSSIGSLVRWHLEPPHSVRPQPAPGTRPLEEGGAMWGLSCGVPVTSPEQLGDRTRSGADPLPACARTQCLARPSSHPPPPRPNTNLEVRPAGPDAPAPRDPGPQAQAGSPFHTFCLKAHPTGGGPCYRPR